MNNLMMMDSSNSEVFVDDEYDYCGNELGGYNNDINVIENSLNLQKNVDFCKKSFSIIRFKPSLPTIISFQITNSFLPKSIIHINNFDKSQILCEITIETSGNWKDKPFSIHISNPTFGNNFIGKNLIDKRIRSFFKQNFRPSPFYLSQNYILTSNVIPDDYKIARLFDLGYEIEESVQALKMFHNDFEQSVKFLETGINTNELEILSVNFNQYPLFYLILEITEIFFELSDHCCICERPLEISGIRPMVCTDKICNFSFTEIGVSANIIGEIKRDPTANDLLISLASTTYQTKFFNPKPPNYIETEFTQFFQNLPSMQQLAYSCNNDHELRKYLRDDRMFEILKFLILANKSHIITLNKPEIQIKECSRNTTQFLLTIATPEFEKEFQHKKKKYGAMYLWHGSNVNRWYSILHNGLKDLGRTEDRVHAGPIYGDGIYQSNLSSYSIPYSYGGVNLYANSSLPKNLIILAMTENAKSPGLRKAIEYEYTQTDERACIVRSLMVVNNSFIWDIVANPPKYIPTLHDVLKAISNQ